MRCGKRASVALGVLAVLGAMVGCAPPTQPPIAPPSPSAEQVVWALGDSQGLRAAIPGRGAGWPDRLGPAVHNGAWNAGGAGFVTPGTNTGRSVVEEAQWLVSTYGLPERFLVMAGTNDLVTWRTSPEMMAGVQELEAFAAGGGIEVWYLAIPPFPHSAIPSVVLDERITFNQQLAALVGPRFVSCDQELLAPGSVWLADAYRLAPNDDVHLGNAGLAVLAQCAEDGFGPPLVASS